MLVCGECGGAIIDGELYVWQQKNGGPVHVRHAIGCPPDAVGEEE